LVAKQSIGFSSTKLETLLSSVIKSTVELLHSELFISDWSSELFEQEIKDKNTINIILRISNCVNNL